MLYIMESVSTICVAISFSPYIYIELLTPPTQLTVLEISPTSFTVSWRPPQEDFVNGSIFYYLINVTDTEGKSVLVFEDDVNSTAIQLKVAELIPDHTHQVSVAVVSEEETGPAAFVWIRTSPFASMYVSCKHITDLRI